jgi:hypothetical protein
MFKQLKPLSTQKKKTLKDVLTIEPKIPPEFRQEVGVDEVIQYSRRLLHRKRVKLEKLEKRVLTKITRVFHIPHSWSDSRSTLENKIVTIFENRLEEAVCPMLELAACFARLENPEDKADWKIWEQDGLYFEMLELSLLDGEKRELYRSLLEKPPSFPEWISKYNKHMIRDKLFAQSAVRIGLLMVQISDEPSLTEEHFLQRLLELSGLDEAELAEITQINKAELRQITLGDAFIDAGYRQGVSKIQDRALKILYRLVMLGSWVLLFGIFYWIAGWHQSSDFWFALFGAIGVSLISALVIQVGLKIWLYGNIGKNIIAQLFIVLVLVFLHREQSNQPTQVEVPINKENTAE